MYPVYGVVEMDRGAQRKPGGAVIFGMSRRGNIGPGVLKRHNPAVCGSAEFA
jgi:hypothetical protein